jgi:hypothetical protein
MNIVVLYLLLLKGTLTAFAGLASFAGDPRLAGYSLSRPDTMSSSMMQLSSRAVHPVP